MSNTSIYKTWQGMKERCSNPGHKDYHNYGGRGIKVCDRWLESFENFYADMGDKPQGMTLDRIEVNGNYEPNNCRWASHTEQGQNRRNNVRLTYNGETKTLRQWAETYDKKLGGILDRYYEGHSAERVIFGIK